MNSFSVSRCDAEIHQSGLVFDQPWEASMTMRHMQENNNARINSMMGIRGGSQFVAPVIDKTQFTFGSAGNTNQNLAQLIDTTGWVSGVLTTRCYSTAGWATGAANM